MHNTHAYEQNRMGAMQGCTKNSAKICTSFPLDSHGIIKSGAHVRIMLLHCIQRFSARHRMMHRQIQYHSLFSVVSLRDLFEHFIVAFSTRETNWNFVVNNKNVLLFFSSFFPGVLVVGHRL